MTPAQIIVLDPAWRFRSNSQAKPGRNPMRHYACMTDDELKALPVREMTAVDSLMFLWTTSPMMARSLDVMQSWGFRYVSQIIWDKCSIGTGFWVRNRHEIVLIGRRGRFPCPDKAPFQDSIIRARKREHSRKPEDLQDRIDEIWPDAVKLEMFARRQRSGWQIWGNETRKFEDVA